MRLHQLRPRHRLGAQAHAQALDEVVQLALAGVRLVAEQGDLLVGQWLVQRDGQLQAGEAFALEVFHPRRRGTQFPPPQAASAAPAGAQVFRGAAEQVEQIHRVARRPRQQDRPPDRRQRRVAQELHLQRPRAPPRRAS